MSITGSDPTTIFVTAAELPLAGTLFEAAAGALAEVLAEGVLELLPELLQAARRAAAAARPAAAGTRLLRVDFMAPLYG
ncbi:MAG TPA: hypothetical protein VGD91_21095 [Trebonia sp.]